MNRRSMKAAALAVALATSLGTTPIPEACARPPHSGAADVVRAKWKYDTGRFEHQNGATWVETDDSGGRAVFREVTRNTDYVELHDRSRDITVRLYDGKMYLKQPGSNSFDYFRDGNWTE